MSMRRSKILNRAAAAALTTLAGNALAQPSSVTVFGTLDLNARYVKNDGSAKRLSLSQDGVNSSELGFRGTEDLGGGLRSSFALISSVNPDTGSVGAKFWNRRSTVSLSGGFGEIRLGRDYVPTFYNNVFFDVFGGVGLGNAFKVIQLLAPHAASPVFGNFVRSDNSIGYFLPPGLGGLYGNAMVGASEGGSNQGRVLNLRIGYTVGPLDVAAAAGTQRFDASQNPAVTGIVAGSEQKTLHLGSSYDFQSFKLMGYVVRESREGLKELRGAIGGSIPVGLGEIRVGYSRSKLTNDLARNTNTVSQVSAAYQYNLSKRSAVYAAVSRLANGANPLGGQVNSVAGPNALAAGTAQTAQPIAGGNSRGFETGIRHIF